MRFIKIALLIITLLMLVYQVTKVIKYYTYTNIPNAVIIKTEAVRDRQYTRHKVLYQYTFNGNTYTSNWVFTQAPYIIGDRISVFIDEQNPQESYISNKIEVLLMPLFTLIVAAVIYLAINRFSKNKQ